MKWYLKVLKQYVDFKGRARRKEFWMFNLFNSLVVLAFILTMIPFMVFMKFTVVIIISILLGCYNMAVLVPSLALCVRRLHDIGKSGWFCFFGCIPLAGGIILLVWFCQNSQAIANRWGANPKGGQSKSANGSVQLHCRVGGYTYSYSGSPTITIGRDGDNDLVINHSKVSRHHAEIVLTNAGYEIIDRGSTNRMIVNGRFVQRTILKNGDIIGLGEAIITFIIKN